MRKFILAVVLLIVLLVGAVFALPRVIDANGWKPEIAAAIESATGYKAEFAGPIAFNLLPSFEFAAENLRVTGADGKELAAVRSIDVKVAAFPLLWGSLDVDRLVVIEPRLTLAIDAAGRPSWAAPGAAPAPAPAPAARSDGLPFSSMRLGDVRLEDGALAFEDRRTGQKIAATGVSVTMALPALDRPFDLRVAMTLNGKPVEATVAVTTPQAFLDAMPVTLKADLKSEPISAHADGTVTLATVPRAAGAFDLAVPSVGALASWLGRPLEAGRADPGRLVARARIKSAGQAYEIEDIALEGAALSLTAQGRIDLSGPTPTIKLAAKGGVLDFDRYLPPSAPSAQPVRAAQPAPAARPAGSPFDALPAVPFDVAFLRRLEAEATLDLGGVKARGLELGRVDLSLIARGGVVVGELKDLVFQGGQVRGKLRMDASGPVPAIDGEIVAERVVVDRLLGGGQPPASGPVGAKLAFKSQGASPKALVEAMTGAAELDLTKTKLAALPTLSDLLVKVALPAASERPSLGATFAYNAHKVEAKLTLDALPRMLASGARFPAQVAIDAEPLRVRFDGRLGIDPAPSVEGKLEAGTQSAGTLVAWLGQPLPAGRPDPGPLSLVATLATSGSKTTLSEAALTGRALKARLSGSVDPGRQPLELDAKLAIDQADLDAYLPEAPPAAAAPAAAAGRPAQPAAEGWSTEPFDFAALKSLQARIEATLGSLTYRGLEMSAGSSVLEIAGGKLDFTLANLKASGGTVQAGALLDGAVAKPKLAFNMKASGVEGRPFLKAFAGSDRISGKADIELKVEGAGANQKELVETLAGAGAFKFLDGAIHGINLAATLRQAQSLGFDRAASEAQKTDFAEMSGTITIDKGVIANSDFNLQAPLLRVTGAGKVPLPPQTVDYIAEATLVATLEGQGGAPRAGAPRPAVPGLAANDGLVGIPIPIKISGPWTRLSYGIDYESVLRGAARQPEKLLELPNQLLDAVRGIGGVAPAPAQQQPVPQQPAQPGPDPLAPLRNLFGR